MSLTIPLKLTSLSARFSVKHAQAFFQAWRDVLDDAEGIAEQAITQSGINLKTGALAQKINYNINSPTEADFIFETKYAGYLDDGFSKYDQRAGLLNGPKAKTSKEGWKYNRIPIEGEIVTISEKPWTQKKRDTKGQFTGKLKWQHPGVQGYHFSKLLQDDIIKKVEHNLSELDFGEEDDARLEQQIELGEDDDDFFTEDFEDSVRVLAQGVPESIEFLGDWDEFWSIVDNIDSYED